MDQPKTIYIQVLSLIQSNGRGRFYNASDFLNIASYESIRKTLQRLEKNAVVIRLSPGFYLYPKQDELLGDILPSLSEIAEAIAKQECIRIFPAGEQALLQLGLTTQVPMKVVYVTDGGPRTIKVGNRTLIFKHTAPKNLSFRGKYSGLVIQALKEIGKGQLTLQVMRQVTIFLTKENPVFAEFDASLAPVWIRDIILEILKQK